MWYVKCVYLVEFANGLKKGLPWMLRDVFDKMNPDNTPSAVFKFIMFCKIMSMELKAELELLKKVHANNSE